MSSRELYYAQDQDALRGMAPLVTSGALRRWFQSLPPVDTELLSPGYKLLEGDGDRAYDVTLQKTSRTHHDTTRVCLTKRVGTGNRDERVTFLGREGRIVKDDNGKLLPHGQWQTFDVAFFDGALGWRRMSPTSYELVQKGSRWSCSYELPNARVESLVPIDARTAEATLLGVVALMAATQPTESIAPSQLAPINKLPRMLLV